MPRYKFKRTEITTEAEVRQVIEASSDEWFRVMVAILYLVGCRITEALNLRRRNVWLDGNNLVVEIGVLKRKDNANGPYANMPHMIHVSTKAPFVADLILPFMSKVSNRESYLFQSPRDPLKHRSRQIAWLSLHKAMKDISPHVFRHDRLMKLAMRGASEAQLMDWAGWTDARPASNYIRVTGRLAAELSEKVE